MKVAYLNYRATGGHFAGLNNHYRDHFVAKYDGTVSIRHSGHYNFWTNSDDGSKLWVNGKQVVNNDGLHGMHWRHGRTYLRAGTCAKIKVVMFEHGGGAGIIAQWSGPGVRRQLIRPNGCVAKRVHRHRRHHHRRASKNHVWGVNRHDQIYYRPGAGGHWKHIGGRLKQVSGTGNNVWGVNRHDQIYYRAGVRGHWKHIGGRLKHISVSGNKVWGVNRHDQIFYRPGVGGHWKHIGGHLKQVSVSGNNVWGVNRHDQIFYRPEVGGHWKHIGGSLKHVTVQGNHVWGVNRHNQIFYRPGVKGHWKRIGGSLKRVSGRL
jgi:hypothetical protein